jgi:glycosyltransferase involved in cell wall biosynthesis
MIHDFARQLGVTDVHITGHVSNAELVAYYEVSDVFLCASEHEGFCVPLTEAFHKGVPVLAYAATAVPATMDGAGVLYRTKDPVHIAGLIDAVVSDAELRERIVAEQDRALERLRRRDFGATLLGFVHQALAEPRSAVPQVTFDFWDQYQAYERLKELQEYRPAVFRGLPKHDSP